MPTFPVIGQEHIVKDTFNDLRSDVKQPPVEESAVNFSQIETTVPKPMVSSCVQFSLFFLKKRRGLIDHRDQLNIRETCLDFLLVLIQQNLLVDQDTIMASSQKGETSKPLTESEKDTSGVQSDFHHQPHSVEADSPNPESGFGLSSASVGNLGMDTSFDRLNESSPLAKEMAGQTREEATIAQSSYGEERQLQRFPTQHETLQARQADMVTTPPTWSDKPESSEMTRSTESATKTFAAYESGPSINNSYEGSGVYTQSNLDHASASESMMQPLQQNPMLYQENQAFGMYNTTGISQAAGQVNKDFGDALAPEEAAQGPLGYNSNTLGLGSLSSNRTDASSFNDMGVYTNVGITQVPNTNFMPNSEVATNMSDPYASSASEFQDRDAGFIAVGGVTSSYQDFSEEAKENRDIGGDDDDDDNIDADLLASRLMKASQEYSSGSDEEPENVISDTVAPDSTISITEQPYYDGIPLTKDSLESPMYGDINVPTAAEEINESRDRVLQGKKSTILQDSQERQNLQEKGRT